MTTIHPTAVVDSQAKLGEHVEIGPYCIVGPDVTIGDRCVLRSHVTVESKTTIGHDNTFFQFSVIGVIPQDLKYHQEESELIIGNNNIFRESCSIHIGTESGGGKTIIGSDNLFMGYVHVAHDCIVGNHNILANYTGLSGHVILDDYVSLGGQNGVVQFVRIGSHSYFGAGSIIDQNVAPFSRGYGNRLQVRGINHVGLKRHGHSEEAIKAVAQIHRIFFRQGLSRDEALSEIQLTYGHFPEAQLFMEFIESVGGNVKRWKE